jgi:aspartate aminotransferase-like enzyme
MAESFQQVMTDISTTLREVYNADAVAIVPGSGTFGMEAVARQFATSEHCVVVRNGWFSYRWTQILEAGQIAASHTVLKASQVEAGTQAPFSPAPLAEVVATIEAESPAVVFAPHVETAAGMMLTDEYISALAEAAHAVGALLVLDCIASGAMWVDMAALGVDVLISAPQKGWSGTPCAALVMLSPAAHERCGQTVSTSFACDLRKWREIMHAYEQGGHAYHATMPTDGLRTFRDAMTETGAMGWAAAKSAQQDLGDRIRATLEAHGYPSVAAAGFQAPGVVVSYTDRPDIKNGSAFARGGIQVAGGVPLMCDERDDFSTFRLGLFGLDKLQDIDRTVATFESALERL